MPRRAFSDLGIPRADGPDDPFGDAALRLSPRSLSTRFPGDARERLCVHVLGPLGETFREELGAEGLTTKPCHAGVLVEGDPALLAGLATHGLHRAEAAALLGAHRTALRPRRAARIMGIVNVTPDSFSDGGVFAAPEDAVEHGLALLEAGAHVLDVGGESTRPGAPEIEEEEELDRVLPVIEQLARETDAPISVDTRKSSVARAALEAGASIVNDVSAGLHDPELFSTAAHFDAELVLMHMKGTPDTMQDAPAYIDAPSEVTAFLRRRVRAALDEGIALERIAIDPGIGFGKRLSDNLALLRELGSLRSLGPAVLIGLSRKSFLGILSGETDAGRRDPETLAATALAAFLGADVHRVHDAGGARRALAVADALSPFELTREST